MGQCSPPAVVPSRSGFRNYCTSVDVTQHVRCTEHIVVAPAQATNKAGDARMCFPSILPAADAPVVFPTNTVYSPRCEVNACASCVRLFIVGDAKIVFNLAELIEDGDADRIHQYLQSHPIRFGRKLTALGPPASLGSPPSALPLDASHLGDCSVFGQLYSSVFHHAFSLQSLQADFAVLAGSSTLEDYTTDDIGDEFLVQCTDTDVIFALAEVVWPDTAWHDLASVYAGWTRDVDKMVTPDQSFSLDIAASKQPIVDPLTNALTRGDLEGLWTDTATPLDG
ncbi:hypothetical protein H310_07262 [Aphanomyces invadans]|uniref:Uncharacterized protein n=1 Tax=Aphanomyces invadans TaxID=157072 RepID=A0A024U398_9STRA|nr:hypothetical protein H310_07262 [Aphanomyces invadans]ETW00705.1 hypothetical protein H310_07262 [Aphanomyces invadans]|eukprot:XP_008870840.1 hypothetical protein H310_07262 [Aphanomyces invadans]